MKYSQEAVFHDIYQDAKWQINWEIYQVVDRYTATAFHLEDTLKVDWMVTVVDLDSGLTNQDKSTMEFWAAMTPSYIIYSIELEQALHRAHTVLACRNLVSIFILAMLPYKISMNAMRRKLPIKIDDHRSLWTIPAAQLLSIACHKPKLPITLMVSRPFCMEIHKLQVWMVGRVWVSMLKYGGWNYFWMYSCLSPCFFSYLNLSPVQMDSAQVFTTFWVTQMEVDVPHLPNPWKLQCGWYWSVSGLISSYEHICSINVQW